MAGILEKVVEMLSGYEIWREKKYTRPLIVPA
jgi:hypothetical protein